MMGERAQPDQQLRIQLEGQLEVVEAWVARVREAARALSGPAWQADHRWHFLGDSNQAAEDAIVVVRQKLEEALDPGAGSMLRELCRVSDEIGRVARRQLLELGIVVTWHFQNFSEADPRLLGVLSCFVVGALLALALMTRSDSSWTMEAYQLLLFATVYLGLLTLVIRLLGGWAMALVPRSTWRLVMTPHSIRTRVGGQWWATEWSQIKSAQVRHVKPMWELIVHSPTPRSLFFRSRPQVLIAELARRGIDPSAPESGSPGDEP